MNGFKNSCRFRLDDMSLGLGLGHRFGFAGSGSGLGTHFRSL